MMTGIPDLSAPSRRALRPARYVVRHEARGWRLYGRTSPGGCGGFAGREEAVGMAEHLAAEAAFLGHAAYLVIESEGQGVEIRRLHRCLETGDGEQRRRLVTTVRWLPSRIGAAPVAAMAG
ncbi:hypothetical protein [Caulobacter sp.]|uniref:hypothetical protein n=1 Tax=Caulobacter sp. TaxID=78 RepID=UPI003BAFCC63